MALSQVYEEADAIHYATLQDQDGIALTQDNIAALTLTIYEKVGEGIVNSKNQFDLRNSGAWDQGCTIADPSGLLQMRLTADDNQITNSANAGRGEIHVLVYEGTTSGTPAYEFKHVYAIEVKNLVKTT